jgi:plastocyanin
MEERKTQARENAGGRASAAARWLPVLGASAAVLVVGATAGPSSAGMASSVRFQTDHPVTVRNNVFEPKTVSVYQGDTVTWTNIEGEHNVRFVDGLFDMPADPALPPWRVSRSFPNLGSYAYYCELHGTAQGVGMAGSVTVNTAPPPPPGTPPPGTPPPGGGTPGGTPPGGDPSPGTPPGGKATTKVTLKVSDATPARGDRVRFSGSVRPERDGRLLQLQRRSGSGSYRTVKKLKLRDAGTSRSRFSGTLRVRSDAVFRARMPGDAGHQSGTSRTRRLRVH